MNLPTREECLELFKKYRLSEKKIKHSLLVAKVVVFLSKKLEEKGENIDVNLAEFGALLHDISRTLSEEADRDRYHAEDGAKLLEEIGLPHLKDIVMKHSLTSVKEGHSLNNWEEKIVYYADKRVKTSILTLDERTQKWPSIFPEQKDDILESIEYIKELEKEIFSYLDFKPEDLKEEVEKGN